MLVAKLRLEAVKIGLRKSTAAQGAGLPLPAQDVLIVIADYHDTSSLAAAAMQVAYDAIDVVGDVLKLVHQDATATARHLFAKCRV